MRFRASLTHSKLRRDLDEWSLYLTTIMQEGLGSIIAGGKFSDGTGKFLSFLSYILDAKNTRANLGVF